MPVDAALSQPGRSRGALVPRLGSITSPGDRATSFCSSVALTVDHQVESNPGLCAASIQSAKDREQDGRSVSHLGRRTSSQVMPQLGAHRCVTAQGIEHEAVADRHVGDHHKHPSRHVEVHARHTRLRPPLRPTLMATFGRMASAPWNDQHVAVANTFWIGDSPGVLHYTHSTNFNARDLLGFPTPQLGPGKALEPAPLYGLSSIVSTMFEPALQRQPGSLTRFSEQSDGASLRRVPARSHPSHTAAIDLLAAASLPSVASGLRSIAVCVLADDSSDGLESVCRRYGPRISYRTSD
jgi:hypothetical protein